MDEQEQKRLANLASGKELNEIFNTFRYSNDQLGRFIGKVKTIAPDTIIAATGDHNMRAIGYPESADAALGHSVPFYLYVPQAYRGSAEYHPERAGSHKDILPTLYNLSLSKSRYYQTGCNLTAPQPDSALVRATATTPKSSSPNAVSIINTAKHSTNGTTKTSKPLKAAQARRITKTKPLSAAASA